MIPPKNLPKSLLVLYLMSGGGPLIATDLPLTLDVSGTISAAPSWQNIFGSEITGLIFNFGSNQAGTAARIDSSSHTVV